MAKKDKDPGPCFFGEKHEFRAIHTRDPFSGEVIIEIRCIKCGAFNR